MSVVAEKWETMLQIYVTFCLFSVDMVGLIMTAKINLRQYVIFI